MAGNNWFQFKQFRIIQEKAAMKVGTDAVLLGAWADVSGAQKVLDVGTGTGVIALMIAQRSDAKITAIEIEKHAASEAAKNAKNSPWPDQISVQNISFQDFAAQCDKKYDCIVSNPPYFSNNLKSASKNVAMARHSNLLSLIDLAQGASKLLSENGTISLILPVEPALKFADLAAKYHLYLNRLTEVSSTHKHPTHRHLIEFSRKQVPLKRNVLSIRTENGNEYTSDYKNLTRHFYLNF